MPLTTAERLATRKPIAEPPTQSSSSADKCRFITGVLRHMLDSKRLRSFWASRRRSLHYSGPDMPCLRMNKKWESIKIAVSKGSTRT